MLLYNNMMILMNKYDYVGFLLLRWLFSLAKDSISVTMLDTPESMLIGTNVDELNYYSYK